MKSCICARDLDKLVTVERLRPSATEDAGGQVDQSLDSNWVLYGKEFGKFTTRGSREFFQGQQVREDITHQFTIRYRRTAAVYSTTMRLRMDGRKFNIAGPLQNVNEENQWLEMPLIEVPVL